MTDQVYSTSYVEPLLDKDGLQRETALDRAVSLHKQYDALDPDAVVKTAETFRAFLAAGSTGYQPKHAAGDA